MFNVKNWLKDAGTINLINELKKMGKKQKGQLVENWPEDNGFVSDKLLDLREREYLNKIENND